MTTTVATQTGTAPTRTAGSSTMRLGAAIALVAGPLLFAAGMLTSPEAASMADEDYIASLARNGTITAVSALFLHYANLLIGAGILAAPVLVRGNRGRRLVTVGSLMTALGFLNVSGMILSDWWNYSAGTLLTAEQSAAVFHGFKGGPLLSLWDGTELFSLLGPILLLAGLARAGVLGWWTIALLVGGVVALVMVPVSLPALAAVGVLLGFSPFVLVGMRLLQRYRLAVG